MADYSALSYAEMSEIVLGIAKEVKRRNPLFVNAYVTHIAGAVAALNEMQEMENSSTTSPGREWFVVAMDTEGEDGVAKEPYCDGPFPTKARAIADSLGGSVKLLKQRAGLYQTSGSARHFWIGMRQELVKDGWVLPDEPHHTS